MTSKDNVGSRIRSLLGVAALLLTCGGLIGCGRTRHPAAPAPIALPSPTPVQRATAFLLGSVTDRGLSPSFVGLPQGSEYENLARTEDNASVLLALMAAADSLPGEPVLAVVHRAIAGWISRRDWPMRTWAAGLHAQTGGRFSRLDPYALQIQDYQPTDYTVGAAAEIGRALVTYATISPVDASACLVAARLDADWILFLIRRQPRTFGLDTLVFLIDGYSQMGDWGVLPWASTYHTAKAIRFIGMMYGVTGDERYARAVKDLARWMTREAWQLDHFRSRVQLRGVSFDDSDPRRARTQIEAVRALCETSWITTIDCRPYASYGPGGLLRCVSRNGELLCGCAEQAGHVSLGIQTTLELAALLSVLGSRYAARELLATIGRVQANDGGLPYSLGTDSTRVDYPDSYSYPSTGATASFVLATIELSRGAGSAVGRGGVGIRDLSRSHP